MKKESKTINYFEMFVDAAKITCEVASQLHSMLCNYTDIDTKTKEIHDTEHRGDDIYHKLYAHLNREFITPIEREDILELAQCIDDATDAIEDVAVCFYTLSITTVRPEAIEMAKLISRATEKMLDATKEFVNFKKSKSLNNLIVELNTIEEEGDRLYRTVVRDLYKSEPDIKEIIKWKDVYDAMEVAIDACEEVADVMEGVILKNS